MLRSYGVHSMPARKFFTMNYHELSLGNTLRPDGLGANLDTASSHSMMTLLPWVTSNDELHILHDIQRPTPNLGCLFRLSERPTQLKNGLHILVAKAMRFWICGNL